MIGTKTINRLSTTMNRVNAFLKFRKPRNITYLKVMNEKERHNGFQYKDGLNVLKGPFQSNPQVSHGAGGFYFTQPEFIHKFFDYGHYLREIKLPQNDPDFKMILDPMGDKWRANKIILGKRYKLGEPETIEFLKTQMISMDYASEIGAIEVLERWKKLGGRLNYTSASLDRASKNGHLEVLEWWKQSGLDMRYSCWAINDASVYGHTKVLQWWKQSGLKMIYTELAMDRASINGQINVLEWWKRSGLELEYTNYALDAALINGQLDVLDWWAQSGLELKYTTCALDNVLLNAALFYENLEVLQWLEKNNLRLTFSPKIVDNALMSCRMEVIEWIERNVPFVNQ